MSTKEATPINNVEFFHNTNWRLLPCGVCQFKVANTVFTPSFYSSTFNTIDLVGENRLGIYQDYVVYHTIGNLETCRSQKLLNMIENPFKHP